MSRVILVPLVHSIVSNLTWSPIEILVVYVFIINTFKILRLELGTTEST